MKQLFSLCLVMAPVFLNAGEVTDAAREGFRSLIYLSPQSPLFPFIVLAGLLLTIATFYFPRFGLIVLLFFVLISTDMPIGRNSGMSRSITIRAEDVILVLVTGGWLLNRAKDRSLAIIKDCPLYGPVLLMSLVIVIATILGYLQGTVDALPGFFFAMKRLEYFWIFFMTLNIMESAKEAKFALFIFLGVSVIIALIGISQFVFFPVSRLTEGGATATAGFGRANTMGDFLLVVIGLTLGLTIFSASGKGAAISVALMIFFTLSLIMTKSRGAYVSLPPLLLVILYITKNKKVLLYILGGGVFIVIYVIFLHFSSQNVSMLMNKHHEDIAEQFTQIADVATEGADVDPSLRSRINSWETSIDQIISYPAFGQGCGSKKLGYSDNQYVRELLETGVIGFVAFIYMNFMIFLFMFRFHLATDDSFLKGLTVGFIGGHAGMMVHGVTMSNFYTIFNMEVFWFVIAVICVFYLNEKERRLTRQNSSNPQAEAPLKEDEQEKDSNASSTLSPTSTLSGDGTPCL